MKSPAQYSLLMLVLLLSGPHRGVGVVSAFSSYLDMLGKLYGYDGTPGGGAPASAASSASASAKYSTRSGQDPKGNMGGKRKPNRGRNRNAKKRYGGGFQVPADGIRALPIDQEEQQGDSSTPSSSSASSDASPELSDQDYMSILNLLEEAAATSMSSLTKEQQEDAAVVGVNGASSSSAAAGSTRDALRERRVSQLQPDGGAFRGARWGSNGTATTAASTAPATRGDDNLEQVRLEMEAVKADLELLRTLAMEVSSPTAVEPEASQGRDEAVALGSTESTSSLDEVAVGLDMGADVEAPATATEEESLPSSDTSADIPDSSNSAVTTDAMALPDQGVVEPAVATAVVEDTTPALQEIDAQPEALAQVSDSAVAIPEAPIAEPVVPVEAKLSEAEIPQREVALTDAIQENEASTSSPADAAVDQLDISAANNAERQQVKSTEPEPTNARDSSLSDSGVLKTEAVKVKNGSTQPAGSVPETMKAMSRREKRRHRRDSGGSTTVSIETKEEKGSGKASSAKEKRSVPSFEKDDSATSTTAVAESSDSSATAVDYTPEEAELLTLPAVDAASEDEPSIEQSSESVESIQGPSADIAAENDAPNNSPLEADYTSAFVTRPRPVKRIGVKWNSTEMGKAVESTAPATTKSSGTFGMKDKSLSTAAFVGKVSTDAPDEEMKESVKLDAADAEELASLDTSEKKVASSASASTDTSTAALVEEVASEADPEAVEAILTEVIPDAIAEPSSEVAVADKAEEVTVDPVLDPSIEAKVTTHEDREAEDASSTLASASSSDVESSVDAAETLIEKVALKTTTASIGVASVESVALGSTNSDAVPPHQNSVPIKKSYSGFGIKPKAAQPFVGKTMPTYKVETILVSEGIKEPQADSEPSSLDIESTIDRDTLFVEEKDVLLSPPSPTPLDFNEQLSAFSAITAASEVKQEAASADLVSVELETETDSKVESPIDADLSFDSTATLSLETTEGRDVSHGVSGAPNAVLYDPMEGESPEVVLSPPPEPSLLDVFDQLSSFSTTTAATESVHREVSESLAPTSSEGENESVPLNLSLVTDDDASPLPQSDAYGPSSIDRVVDLIQEGQALTEQDKFEEAEVLYSQALDALNSIEGPDATIQDDSYVAASVSAPVHDSGSVGIETSLLSKDPESSAEAAGLVEVTTNEVTPSEAQDVPDSVDAMSPVLETREALEPLPTASDTEHGTKSDVLASSTVSDEDSNSVREVPVHRPFFLNVLDSDDDDSVDVVNTHASVDRVDSAPAASTWSKSSETLPISNFQDTKWLEDAISSVQPFVKSLKPIISGLIDGAVQMVQNLPKPRVPPSFEADSDDVPILDTKGMTERIMKRTPVEGQATGAGGASTWDAFQRVEKNWKALKESKPQRLADVVEFVTDDGAKGNPMCWQKLNEQRGKELDYDVVVCGGTLGIFFATALRLKGHRVAVMEAGKLRGREQEWNLSLDELDELVKLGVLTQEDVDAAITTEFPGCRSGFKNKESTPLDGGYFDNGIGYECYTPNVLNLGVTPSILLEKAAQRFRELGGVIMEETRLEGVVISEARGAAVDLGADADPVTAHLVLDCMGNASPISRQQRRGLKPDGVCAVVGSCASGFDNETNTLGDIIYTNSMIQDKGENGMLQYFWEAFPVGIGRNGKEPGSSDTKTTYMFTYMDANEKRPSLETLMEDYWRMLPKYQPSISNPEIDLDVKRVLFAYFPTYRSSPLKPRWSRILAVGDASGIQSPLSFGGFGALTRHLDRISSAVSEALDKNLLDKDDLAEINAYLPNLSASWMFQKAMSVKVGQKVDPTFVNRLLATNFEVMDKMGQRTIKPFLQDVVRFDGLVGSLARSFVADPGFMPDIVNHVGIPTLVEWLAHVSMMGAYGALDTLASPLVRAALVTMETDDKTKFQWRRRMEAWRYGSGNDYQLPKDN